MTVCGDIAPNQYGDYERRCCSDAGHGGAHSDGWVERWWSPQIFVCEQCDASTGGVVTEREARESGFWTLCDGWYCGDCTTFIVSEE
jgi:hypothetical protein